MDESDLFGLNAAQRAFVPCLRLATRLDGSDIAKLAAAMRGNPFMAGAHKVSEAGLASMFASRSDLVLLMLKEEGVPEPTGYVLASTTPLPPHPCPEFCKQFTGEDFAYMRRGRTPDTERKKQSVVGKGDAILFSYEVAESFRGEGRAHSLVAGVKAVARERGCDRLVALVSGTHGRKLSWDKETHARLTAHGFGEFATGVSGTQYMMQLALPPKPGRWSAESCQAARWGE
jgi:GNAT superfamily N-acetyltransferase